MKARTPIKRISLKKLSSLDGKYVGSTITGKRKAIKRKSRKPSEFRRIYHSKERVEFVKSLPCYACGAEGFSQNAHVLGNGGTGRKADHTTIAPLCGFHIERESLTTTTYYVGCHFMFDEQRYAFDKAHPDFNAETAAERTRQLWLSSLRRNEVKLNRMICPTCNHESLTDAAYARCDACGVTFYASQSKGVALPNPHVTVWRVTGGNLTFWPSYVG